MMGLSWLAVEIISTPDAVFSSPHEFGDRFRLVPTLVAHFDHSRILDELPQQLLQVFAVQRGVLERDGKLDEQRAQLAFRGQRVQTLSGKPFVLVIRADAGRRSW